MRIARRIFSLFRDKVIVIVVNMAVFLLSVSCRSTIGEVIYITGEAGTITFDDYEVNF